MSSTDVVWEQRRYDGGWYGCKVVRDGDFGRLTITLLGVLNYKLHEERVKFDKPDPDKWRKRCEVVINDVSLRTLDQMVSPG
jgi:hypothetical protein